jgi:hypothetical protein
MFPQFIGSIHRVNLKSSARTTNGDYNVEYQMFTTYQYVCVLIKIDTCRWILQSRCEEMNVMFVTIKAMRADCGARMSRWHLSGLGPATVGGFV